MHVYNRELVVYGLGADAGALGYKGEAPTSGSKKKKELFVSLVPIKSI